LRTHEDIEVAVIVEDAGIEQLILHLLPAASPIRLLQVGVGICRLGILVEVLHVGMSGCAVEVEIVFLHVLAVIPLTVRESEEAFLEDRVLAFHNARAKHRCCLSSDNPARPSSPQR